MQNMGDVRVILVSTSLPANIGSAARAMKTMGFGNLYLVKPKNFPSQDAVALASGADDILKRAVLRENLTDALEGVSLVFATTARSRHISLPVSTPKAAAEEIRGYDGKIAMVFGRETSGLSNEELRLCNRIINIPSNPDFSSLNIAQAVQICLYEIRCSSAVEIKKSSSIPKGDRLALSHEIRGLEDHLEAVMRLVDYFDPAQPKHLLGRIHRFFSRSGLLHSEVQILRGFLRFVVRKVKQLD